MRYSPARRAISVGADDGTAPGRDEDDLAVEIHGHPVARSKVGYLLTYFGNHPAFDIVGKVRIGKNFFH